MSWLVSQYLRLLQMVMDLGQLRQQVQEDLWLLQDQQPTSSNPPHLQQQHCSTLRHFQTSTAATLLRPGIPPPHTEQQNALFKECLVKCGLEINPTPYIWDPQYTYLPIAGISSHMQKLFHATDKDTWFVQVPRNHNVAIANISWQCQQIADECGSHTNDHPTKAAFNCRLYAT